MSEASFAIGEAANIMTSPSCHSTGNAPPPRRTSLKERLMLFESPIKQKFRPSFAARRPFRISLTLPDNFEKKSPSTCNESMSTYISESNEAISMPSYASDTGKISVTNAGGATIQRQNSVLMKACMFESSFNKTDSSRRSFMTDNRNSMTESNRSQRFASSTDSFMSEPPLSSPVNSASHDSISSKIVMSESSAIVDAPVLDGPNTSVRYQGRTPIGDCASPRKSMKQRVSGIEELGSPVKQCSTAILSKVLTFDKFLKRGVNKSSCEELRPVHPHVSKSPLNPELYSPTTKLTPGRTAPKTPPVPARNKESFQTNSHETMRRVSCSDASTYRSPVKMQSKGKLSLGNSTLIETDTLTPSHTSSQGRRKSLMVLEKVAQFESPRKAKCHLSVPFDDEELFSPQKCRRSFKRLLIEESEGTSMDVSNRKIGLPSDLIPVDHEPLSFPTVYEDSKRSAGQGREDPQAIVTYEDDSSSEEEIVLCIDNEFNQAESEDDDDDDDEINSRSQQHRTVKVADNNDDDEEDQHRNSVSALRPGMTSDCSNEHRILYANEQVETEQGLIINIVEREDTKTGLNDENKWSRADVLQQPKENQTEEKDHPVRHVNRIRPGMTRGTSFVENDEIVASLEPKIEETDDRQEMKEFQPSMCVSSMPPVITGDQSLERDSAVAQATVTTALEAPAAKCHEEVLLSTQCQCIKSIMRPGITRGLSFDGGSDLAIDLIAGANDPPVSSSQEKESVKYLSPNKNEEKDHPVRHVNRMRPGMTRGTSFAENDEIVASLLEPNLEESDDRQEMKEFQPGRCVSSMPPIMTGDPSLERDSVIAPATATTALEAPVAKCNEAVLLSTQCQCCIQSMRPGITRGLSFDGGSDLASDLIAGGNDLNVSSSQEKESVKHLSPNKDVGVLAAGKLDSAFDATAISVRKKSVVKGDQPKRMESNSMDDEVVAGVSKRLDEDDNVPKKQRQEGKKKDSRKPHRRNREEKNVSEGESSKKHHNKKENAKNEHKHHKEGHSSHKRSKHKDHKDEKNIRHHSSKSRQPKKHTVPTSKYDPFFQEESKNNSRPTTLEQKPEVPSDVNMNSYDWSHFDMNAMLQKLQEAQREAKDIIYH